MSITRKQAQAMVEANSRLTSMGILSQRDTSQADAWSVGMMNRLHQMRLKKLQDYLERRRMRQSATRSEQT